jgi:hypothetical protein
VQYKPFHGHRLVTTCLQKSSLSAARPASFHQNPRPNGRARDDHTVASCWWSHEGVPGWITPPAYPSACGLARC